MEAFFFIGAIGFWLVFLLIFIMAVVYISNEKYWPVTIFFILYAAYIYFFGNGQNIFLWITSNFWLFSLYLLGYAIAGTIYMMIDFYFYCQKQKDKGLSYLLKNEITEEDRRKSIMATYKPNVANMKGELTGIMTYWPFHLVSQIFKLYLKDLFDFFYRRVASKLQAISDKTFNKF